jgi:hypothetical protein
METLYAATDEPSLVGAVIAGSYRITGVLGSGAMGHVYRAEDIERGTAVAIKLLHKQLGASKEAAARFRREAFVGVRLLHPNCVPVLDAGTTESGAFYMVMELLEGEPLGSLIDREGPLPWRRALHIAQHVLRGLDHAHRESVVHRDIKPDNIFISPREGDADFARILDFGIAKLVGDAAGAAITQAGISVGTPTYLSPEQAMGGAIDGRSDLYSLSIVLYEMLTGRAPFAELPVMKRLLAHATQPVPSFATMTPDVAVPPEVETLVMDGLAKRPDDRIGSPAEYLVRIEELLGPETAPVAAAEPDTPPATTPGEPVDAPRRRARGAWIASIVAVTLALVAGIGVFASHDRGQVIAPSSLAGAPAPTPPAPQTREIAAALDTLEHGKTCAARKKAVERLRALGDASAIPHLERARSRPRRGKNANACLRAAADAAIRELSVDAQRD